MSKSRPYKNVSEYFEAQPKQTKERLEELKDCILKVVPNAKEMLNYNIPAYTLISGGKREEQIMIAANKGSVGFYPHPTTMAEFEDELKAYKRGKGSVQFPLDHELPKGLIARMITYRLNIVKR